MDDLVQMLIDACKVVVPVAVSAFAPVITAAVKQAIGDSLPATLKPVINAVAGAALAGLVGADPGVGVAGAMLGNRVREAYKAAA